MPLLSFCRCIPEYAATAGLSSPHPDSADRVAGRHRFVDMVPLSADVNWLLSAIAQASAALVAIVGGLLVSRYVTLHAEQQGARRRADDLGRRIEEARSHRAAAERQVDLYFVDDFLDDTDVFEAIFRGQGEATPEEVLAAKDSDADHLNHALLDEQLGELQAEFLAAVQALLPIVPEGKDHAEWLEFKRGRDFVIGHRNLWEWVYDRIVDERVEAATAAEREARKKSPFGNLLSDYKYDTSSIARLISPEVRGLRGVVSSQHEIAQVNVLRGRVESARAEVRALDQERRLAEETFDATRQPEGFSLALQVLSILAALGMGVPVIAMVFVPYTLPWLARVGVVVVFFVGVLLLLRFLFAYASYLRGARPALPATVVGLLDPRRGGRSSPRGKG